jgi:dTDP-4-amino-4,6-dideoxygalactose transaminase
MILCSNPLAQYTVYRSEIDKAIAKVLRKGRYVLGEEVASFEDEFASYIGTKSAVGVGSGTEALHIALKACGIGRGDEVITVSHTAVATVAAIELAGAKPVFVDIEPGYYTMDASKVEAAITRRTKAVLPVHIYGQPVDIDKIAGIARKRKLFLIEDCAQAHGAEYKGRKAGSLGDIACFSFYPTKNLGALGDGGMVLTSDKELAEKTRLLREYGWAQRYVSQIPGWNTRLDEIQAAVLNIKLKYLDADNQRRRDIAGSYDRGLADTGLALPKERSGCRHAYHLYVVRTRRRDELSDFLRGRGISALIHYPFPVHRQPAYRSKVKLKVSEACADEVLSLPMYPELSLKEVRTVIRVIKEFVR